MLLLPLLNYLLMAHRSLCPICLLHGLPLLISGRWALQSPASSNNLISGVVCMLPAMPARTSLTSRVNSAPTMYGMCYSTPLASCTGYHLLPLCHPDCLITMAAVSMALHVSYMRSLCTKEWRTGRQMILSAVRHGVAKEFIKFCAGLRVNKRYTPPHSQGVGTKTMAALVD